MGKKSDLRPRFLGGVFSQEGAVVRVLNWLSDLILLNVLCIVCSLPIITAGASITACARYSAKLIEGTDNGVWRGFRKGFRDNFRQVTPVWLGMLAVAGLLWADSRIVVQMPGQLRMVLQTVVTVVEILWLVELIYVFPLMAAFENTRRACVKNALLIAVRHLPQTLLLMVVTLSPMLVYLLLPQTLGWLVFLVLVIWVEAMILAQAAIQRKIFLLYRPK